MSDCGELVTARVFERRTSSGPVIYEVIAKYQFTDWQTKYCGHSQKEAARAYASVMEGVNGSDSCKLIASWNLNPEDEDD